MNKKYIYKKVLNLFIRIAVSTIVLCIIEVVLKTYSLDGIIGANIVTIPVTAVLGIPGLLMLAGIGMVGKIQ